VSGLDVGLAFAVALLGIAAVAVQWFVLVDKANS
jgi:hypothetical protein